MSVVLIGIRTHMDLGRVSFVAEDTKKSLRRVRLHNGAPY